MIHLRGQKKKKEQSDFERKTAAVGVYKNMIHQLEETIETTFSLL